MDLFTVACWAIRHCNSPADSRSADLHRPCYASQTSYLGRNRAETVQPRTLPSRATSQLYCIVNLALENLVAHTANPV